MKFNNFKSAQHSSNYKNLQLKKLNKKQPVKVYSEEEKKALAAQMGVGTVPSRVPEKLVKEAKLEENVDLSVLDPELLKQLGVQVK
jgi:hypothetical protein